MQALKEEGRVEEAEAAFNQTISLDDPGQPSIGALRIMAQMRQQMGRHADAIKLLDRALGHDRDDQVRWGMGCQAGCFHILAALQPDWASRPAQQCACTLPCLLQRVELLYLRAICHHALGLAREAVKDYEACLTYVRPAGSASDRADGPDVKGNSSRELSEEARGFQFLSFYQKEVRGGTG